MNVQEPSDYLKITGKLAYLLTSEARFRASRLESRCDFERAKHIAENRI